jgi:hypothetical protein
MKEATGPWKFYRQETGQENSQLQTQAISQEKKRKIPQRACKGPWKSTPRLRTNSSSKIWQWAQCLLGASHFPSGMGGLTRGLVCGLQITYHFLSEVFGWRGIVFKVLHSSNLET